tara:strand:+ start:300 stop:953 length:654 start_codon:yes stop_codon:yes gene_type:complete
LKPYAEILWNQTIGDQHGVTRRDAMESATPQLASIRSRLRMLLDAHMDNLQPQLLQPARNEVVIEQGAAAESLLIVNKGRLVVELEQTGQPQRTLAIVEAGDLLGEMALFGDGLHTARVRVIATPAELLCISREALLQAVLFDSELTAEILHLSSERCRQSNRLVTLLLNGLQACGENDAKALERICRQLQQGPESMHAAATTLMRLLPSQRSSSSA